MAGGGGEGGAISGEGDDKDGAGRAAGGGGEDGAISGDGGDTDGEGRVAAGLPVAGGA